MNAASKLKFALKHLRDILNNDNLTNEDDERAVQEKFNDSKAKLETIIVQFSKNIECIKQYKLDMQKCVNEEHQVIDSTSAKSSRNANLQQHATKTCDSFKGEFIVTNKNRLEIIATIEDILKIVAKRFKQLPEDLVNYLESVT